MTALLRYSLSEGLSSLARGWRANLLSVGVIAAAVFVAGAVLLVSINVQQVLERLSATADLTIYLRHGATAAQRRVVEQALAESPIVASAAYVSAEIALGRFKRDLPDIAELVGTLGENPLPPSFEVRLRERQTVEGAGPLVRQLEATGAIEDVRYDRQVLDRLLDGLHIVRRVGIVIAALLMFAAVVTITIVLRLAYLSRREEMDILYLVGIPFSAIRGPFVVEGLLQAGLGALVAMVLLSASFSLVQAQYGAPVAAAFGVSSLRFLSFMLTTAVVVATMVVGALAGLGAAWRRP